MSVRVSPAGWGDDAVHAQVFHHLAVVIEGVGDAEFGAVQAQRLALAYGLQHVFDGQRRGGLVALGERVFEELEDVGFGLQVRGAVAVF